MLCTLFFDEADSNSVFRVRRNPSTDALSVDASLSVQSPDASSYEHQQLHAAAPQYHYPSFGCHGDLHVPELRASMQWWLDRSSPRVHMLAVSTDEIARSERNSQTRMITVEFPLGAGERLLTCGVTKLPIGGDHCVAVSWLSSSMVAGYVRVTLQRDNDSSGTLLLTPEGAMVQSQPLPLGSTAANLLRLTSSSVNSPSASRELTTMNHSMMESNGHTPTIVSACVLAEVPPQDRDVASLLVLTDGTAVWRVQLFADGRTSVRALADDKRKDEVGAVCEDIIRSARHGASELSNIQNTSQPAEHRSSALSSSQSNGGSSSWLGKLWGGNGSSKSARPARRYLAVSAVQHSPYVALLRWNGLVEFYDSELETVDYFPTCRLPSDQVDPAAAIVQQWSTLNPLTNSIHVVSCFGELENRRVVWSRVPQMPRSSDEKVALRCSYSAAPPTAMSAPIGCVVNDQESLTIAWDLGVEEDAHMLCGHTIGALNQPTRGVSAVVQFVQAACGAEEEWAWQSTQNYLCHGAKLHAVLSQGPNFVLVERLHDTHRTHLVQPSKHLWQRLMETLRVDNDYSSNEDDDVQGGKGEAQYNTSSMSNTTPIVRELHLIPTADSEDSLFGEAASDAYACLWEGYDVLQSTPNGARLLADLLRDALTSPIAGQLPSWPRILTEAQLAGYVPSGLLSEAHVLAALSAITSVQSRSVPITFCSYNRQYITHTVSQELLGRIAFLSISYLGWASTHALSHLDSVTREMLSSIQFLAAAYHAVNVLGPEVSALAEDQTEHMVDSILRKLICPVTASSAPLFAARVANNFQRCHSACGHKASLTWAAQLQHAHPFLRHFTLVYDVDSWRTTRVNQQTSNCLAVCQSLSQFSVADVTTLLFNYGLFSCDAFASTSFSLVNAAELKQWVREEQHLVPKLYAVGIFRRLVPVNFAVGMSASATNARRFYLPALLQVLQCVRARNGLVEGTEATPAVAAAFPTLQTALEELHLESLLSLSQAALADQSFGECYHDLEAALDQADRLEKLHLYTEHVHHVVSRIVESACASQGSMNALINTSHESARLAELLVTRWYNTIARMPTKSASRSTETLRYRAIMGLHRYLMTRHAYAQCGRVMSDLASLLRCSPLRRSAELSISVGELAALALQAVELIAPHHPATTAVEAAPSNQRLHGSPLSTGFSWRPSLEGGAQAASLRLLSRDDLPWLRRRVFQAHCERKLWRRGSTIDCTDLWVDGAPQAEYWLAVRKLTTALMETKLWADAYRFASLAGSDSVEVLKEWALHLAQTADHVAADAEEVQSEWEELMRYCAQESTLSNQFAGYRTVLLAVLTFSYKRTYPELRRAHEAADPYSAIATLLHAFELIRARQEETGGEEAIANREAWLVWADASAATTKVLRQGSNAPAIRRAYTAGVVDPLARYAQELLDHPTWLVQLRADGAEVVARELLSAVAATS